MLGELQAMSDEHFFTSPDDVNWADVGNVSPACGLAGRLRR
jgi:hypothetical protein